MANIKEALAMIHAQGHIAVCTVCLSHVCRAMRNATVRIHPLHTQVHALSGLYETAPAYVTDQPDFLNAAAIVTTPLGPHQLLHQLKSIEVCRLCVERGCVCMLYG